MRPYATVSPLFWTGATGKRLRKNPDAQRVAFYLMTSPHAHQSGLYYLPLMYLCHEVGISKEGASKALAALSADGFCTYDTRVEWVWVREMAAWQIGTGLAASDKRCKGIQYYLRSLPVLPFTSAFVARYANDFDLKGLPDNLKSLASPLEGAFSEKKGASSDQDQEQDLEQDQNSEEGKRGSRRAPRATRRMPTDFEPSEELRAWAAETVPLVNFERSLEKIRNHEFKSAHTDWPATFRNWLLTDQEAAERAGPRKSNGTTEREHDPDDHSMDGFEGFFENLK